MQPRLFAERFPRETSFTNRHERYKKDLEKSQHWSTLFGSLLHDRLSTGIPMSQEDVSRVLSEHSGWLRQATEVDFAQIMLDAARDDDVSSEAWDAMHDLGFHLLSATLSPMWRLALAGETETLTPAVRHLVINEMQVNLGMVGLVFYQGRHSITTGDNDYKYFGGELEKMRTTESGIMGEIDLAVVLLELAKKDPNLIFIPSPRQFEDTDSRVNTDFIGINTVNDEIIGIQMKNTATRKVTEGFDKNYTVVINGKLDLGNVVTKRTNRFKSAQPISWPGMISLNYLTSISPHRAAKNPIFPNLHDQRYLLQKQYQAKSLLAGVKPDYRASVVRVADRVLPRLYPESDTQTPQLSQSRAS